LHRLQLNQTRNYRELRGMHSLDVDWLPLSFHHRLKWLGSVDFLIASHLSLLQLNQTRDWSELKSGHSLEVDWQEL
jgi:hypothetical protein